MSGYNTKIITYKNQTQIKHYGRSIKTDYSLSDEQKKDRKRKADADRTPQQIAKSIESSRNRTINSIYQYALANDWELFITLTFNPVKVDSKNYDSVENANRLVRKYIKKSQNIDNYDFDYIRRTQDAINYYPRKLFNGFTSSEQLIKEIGFLIN